MMEEIASERLLEPNYLPGQYDVLCGRGSKCFNHPGNKFFRKLVENNLQRYSAASMKHGKTSIIYEVINHIRRCSPNGGFIKEDLLSGRFYEVGDFTAREKTSQAFRDVLHEKYKSSYAQRNCDRKKRRKKKQVMTVASTPSSCQMDTSLHDAKEHLTKSMSPYNNETNLLSETNCNQVALAPFYSVDANCDYEIGTAPSNLIILPERNEKMVPTQPQTSYALMSNDLDVSVIQAANVMGYHGNQFNEKNDNRPSMCFGKNTFDDVELLKYSELPNSSVTEIDDTFLTGCQSIIPSPSCSTIPNRYSYHNEVDKYTNETSTSLIDSFVFNKLMMLTDNGNSNMLSDFEPAPIPYK